MAKTRKLYIYIPGFEYDSKGPLHIDAILVIVSKGELILENGVPINLLTTYCYREDAKIETGKTIKGDLVFRSMNTDLLKISGYYPTSKLKINSPQWTEDSNRALPGFFYDFITTTKYEETTHHVIGIQDVALNCQSVSNFNSNEHDGLFCIGLDELDIDLKIHYYFYSRIKNSEIDPITKTITVGEIEDPSILTCFKKSDYINFDNEYILIGELPIYYNPIASGSTVIDISSGFSVRQYMNLKVLGPKKQKWELPVNADLLVTDMSEKSGAKKEVAGNRWFYQQYSYCTDKSDTEHYLTHYLDTNLSCNKNSTSWGHYGPFYGNFYPGILSFPDIPNADGTAYKNGTSCLLKINTKFEDTWTDWYRYWVNQGYKVNDGVYYPSAYKSVNFNYTISPIDINSLKYLYNQNKTIKLYNLALDADCGEPGAEDSTAMCLYIDTLTLPNGTWAEGTMCRDYLNYNDRNGKPDYSCSSGDVIYPHNTRGLPANDGSLLSGDFIIKTTLTLNNIETPIKLNTESATSCWFVDNSGTKWPSYGNKSLEHMFYNYSATRSNDRDYITSYAGNIQSHSVTGGTGRPYYTTSSILDTGSFQLDLNSSNNINLSFELQLVRIPYVQYTWITQRLWGATKAENDDAELGVRNHLYNYGDGFNSDLTAEGKQNMIDVGYGKTSVGILQMYLLNLAESDIEYDNKGNYSIVPYLYNNENGYYEKSLIDVNIEKTNLLDPDPEQLDTFELSRILSNEQLYYPYELLRNIYSGGIEYDTSFCNECRFLGTTPETETETIKTINLNKSKNLTEGLYVFKVTDYTLSNTHTLSFNLTNNSSITSYNNIKGYNNLWLFYVNENTTTTLTLNQLKLSMQIKNSSNRNIIGGIGLYKVDLKNITKTSIQFLLEYLKTYKDNHQILENVFYINPEFPDSENIFNTIIFPTAYCAKENIKIGKKVDRDSSRIKSDYANDLTINPFYHFYNFKYLPQLAIYKIAAFYSIPKESNSKLEDDDEIELVLPDIDVSVIREKRIKT